MKKLILLTIILAIPLLIFAERDSERYSGGIEFGSMFQITSPTTVNSGGGSEFLTFNLEKRVTTFNVNLINGFDLKIPNMRTFFGIGTGIEYSKWMQKELWVFDVVSDLVNYEAINMPLFLRVKVDFAPCQVSPFFQFDLGYNVLLNSRFLREHSDMSYKRSGVLLSPAFGMNINLNENQRFFIAVHYTLQEQDRSEFHSLRNIHSFGFKLGVLF
jgi:hypothetical protein